MNDANDLLITEDAEFTNYIYSNYNYPETLIANIGAPRGGPPIFINTHIEYPNTTFQPTSEFISECIQGFLNNDNSKFWNYHYLSQNHTFHGFRHYI